MRSALFALLFASVCVASAARAECGNTTYGGVYSSYPLPEVGLDNSKETVLQGGHTITCGSSLNNLSFDAWGSRGRTDPYSNEFDSTLTGVMTRGRLRFEGSVSYWALHGPDMVAAYGQVGIPIAIGSATVEPYYRASRWIGLSHSGTTTLSRPGMKLEIPLNQDWSFSADGGRTLAKGAIAKRTSHVDLKLERAMGNAWSGAFEVQVTQKLNTTFGFSISRDW